MGYWDKVAERERKKKEEEAEAERKRAAAEKQDSVRGTMSYWEKKAYDQIRENRGENVVRGYELAEPEEEEPSAPASLGERLAARGITIEYPEEKKSEPAQPVNADTGITGRRLDSFDRGVRNSRREEAERAEEQKRLQEAAAEAHRDETVRNPEWLAALRDPEEIEAELKKAESDERAYGLLGRGTDVVTGVLGLAERAGLIRKKEDAGETVQDRVRAKKEEAGERADELRAELAETRRAGYEKLRENPDFAEKSQYHRTGADWQAYNPYQAYLDEDYAEKYFPDPVYDYINGSGDAGRILENRLADRARLLGLTGRDFAEDEYQYTQYQDMTADERAMYNYLHETGGKEAADEYLAYLRPDLYARQAAREQEEADAFAREHPVLASAGTVAASTLKGQAYGAQLADLLGDGEIDENAPYNRIGYISSAQREAVTQRIGEKWGQWGEFAYGTGMSMLEFLLNIAVTGGAEAVSLAIMGTGAAADATLNAQKRGLGETESFVLGTIAGAAEVVSEKVSIDKLFGDVDWRSHPVKYILTNILSEGEEEVESDVINWLADALVSWDKSEWMEDIREYKKDHPGAGDGKAFLAAVMKRLKEGAMDFLGGAISGGLMAGGRVAADQIVKGAQRRTDRAADVAAAREAYGAAEEKRARAEQPRAEQPRAEQPQEMITLPTAEEAERAEAAERAESPSEARNEPEGETSAGEESGTLRFGTEPETRTLTPTAEEAEREDAIRAAEETGNITRATGIRYGIDEKTISRAERLSELTGHRIIFYEGQPRNGAVENGFTQKSTGDIYINKNAKNPFLFTFAHEFTHNLEGTAEYRSLMSHIKSRAAEQGTDWAGRRADMRELYERGTEQAVSDDYIDEEIAADWIGENLADEKTIRDICRAEPTLAQRIRGAIDGFIVRAGNAGGIITTYEERKYRNIVRLMDKYLAAREEMTDAQERAGRAVSGDRAVMTENTEGSENAPKGGRETPEEYLARMEELYEAGEISDEEYDAAQDLAAEMESTGRGIERSTVEDEGPRGKIPEIIDRVRGRRASLSEDTEERKQTYMDAVARGDVKTQQRMVDEEAEANGYDTGYLVWRGDSAPYNIMKTGAELDEEADGEYNDDHGNLGNGLYFTPDRNYAQWFAGRGGVVRKFYLKSEMADLDSADTRAVLEAIARDMEEEYGEAPRDELYDALMEETGTNGIRATGVGGFSGGAQEAIVRESWQAKLADPVTYDDNGDPIPVTERFNDQEPDNRYSLAEEAGETSEREAKSAAEDDDGNVLTGELRNGTMVRYSLTSWNNTDKAAVAKNLANAGYTDEEINRYIENVNGIAAIIAGDRGRLDYDAATHQVYMKPNADYVVTLDASTLCAKRLLYQGTFDKIAHILQDRVMTPEDLIDLANMLGEDGYQTPCGICYVESRRRWLSKYADEWLQKYTGEYKPRLEDVITTDGLERLRREHPDTYQDFVSAMAAKGSANPKVVQMRTDYRGDINRLTDKQIEKIIQIGGVRFQSFSDFETPHLIDMMQAVLDLAAKKLPAQAYTKVPNFAWVFGDTGIKINLSLIGGLDEYGRLTFSSVEGMDFDEAMRLRERYSKNVGTILVGKNKAHILAAMADDRIDFIIPFHKSGWSAEELAKMVSLQGFEDFKDYQNERIIIGKKKKTVRRKTQRGVDNWMEKNAEKYADINVVQDADGYTIEYTDGYESESFATHKERTGEELDNFTPNGPEAYWDYNLSGKENAEKYLQMCAEAGRLPKFWNFLVDNGDGSFSLQPDGSTDGYWKTLIDYKMYDNDGVGAPQEEVRPNFNMDEAERVLAEYTGGANQLPSASDEFVQKYVRHYEEVHGEGENRYSISPEEAGEMAEEEIEERDRKYLQAVEDSDEETMQRMVDDAAVQWGAVTNSNRKPIHLYHGTPRFGFTKFKDEHHKVPFIYTSTDRTVSAHYAGDNHYASVRPIGTKYRTGTRTADIIENAKWVLGSNYHVMSKQEKHDAFEKYREIAVKVADKLDELPTGGVDVPYDVANALAWVENMFFTIRDSDFRFNADDDAETIDSWQRDIDEDIRNYNKNRDKVREFYDNNRNSLDENTRNFLQYLLGYELGDAAIDIEYQMRPVVTNDDILVNEAGNIDDPLQLKERMDRIYQIGAYDLYGNLGDNPFIFDANGAQFYALKVPEMGDDYYSTDTVCKWAYEHGYTGVVMKNIYDYGDKADNYVFFDSSQLKSADPVTYDDKGEPIKLSKRFDPEDPDIRRSLSQITPEEDEAYLEAVRAGDEETQNEMVREAAEQAFSNSRIRDEEGNLLYVYHGTDEEFTVFDRTKTRANMDIQGSFFSPWEIDAAGYGGKVGRYFLNITNPAPEAVAYRTLNRFKGQNGAGIKAREYLESLGYDGVNNGDEEYIAFNPEQIKSADPVTYDDDGEPIKLSERFNPEDPDIRRSLAEEEQKRTFADEQASNQYDLYMAVGEDPDFEEIVEKAAYDGRENQLLPRERNVYQYLRDRYGSAAAAAFLRVANAGRIQGADQSASENDLAWMTGADRRRAYEGAELIVQAATEGLGAAVDPSGAVYRRFIKDVGVPIVEQMLRGQDVTADDVLDAIGENDILSRQAAQGTIDDALRRVRGMLRYPAASNPEDRRAEHPNNLTQSEADARLERLIDQFYAPVMPAETENGTETETESELPPEVERSTKLFEGDPLDWMTQGDKNEVYFRAQKFTAEILRATDAVKRQDMKEQTERRNKRIGIPTAEKLLRGQEVTAEEILEGLQSLGKKVKDKGKFLEFVDSRIGNLQKWLGYVREESIRNAAERPMDYKELKSKAYAEVRRAERQLTDAVLAAIGRNVKFGTLEYRQFRADVVRPLIESVLREETPDIGQALAGAGVDPVQAAAVTDEIMGAVTTAAERLDEVRKSVMSTEENRKRREERNAELDARIPDDDAGLIRLGETYKEAQRQWNRMKAATTVSPETKELAHDIAIGKISEDDAHMQHPSGWSIVKAYADAEREFREQTAAWERYVKRLSGEWRTEADKALRDADAMNAKDKKAGLQYMTETATRNVRDVFGEYADILLDTYFRPVAASEAESTRFKREFAERVRKLKLGQKAAKGNLNSESYAVQFLGEAEDNVRVLTLMRDPDAVRDGMTVSEWQEAIDAFKAANPNMDMTKVHAAIKEFQAIYADLLSRMNGTLVRNGYLPINVRRGYFPHFTMGSDGVLAKFGQLLGIGLDSQALPTSINGLTDMFKPGKSWFSHALERTGFRTDYGAVYGFESYLKGVADVIYQTENIRKLRALATQTRYNFGDEGIKEQIKRIEMDETLDEAQKMTAIANINEKGKFQLSQFVAWLDEYTNLLANKKSKLDRGFESTFGRGIYNWVKNVEGRVAANMIAGNLGSALTNFIPLNQAASTIGTKYVLKGAYDTMTNRARGDGFADWSDFLVNRRGVDPLVRGNLDKLSDWLSKSMNIIDDFVSETIVRGAYTRYRTEGMDMDSAMQMANETAAGLMADRSKGAMPTLFESRNPAIKLLTQFQLEVNNEWRVITKDIPKGVFRTDREKKQAVTQIAWTLLRYFLGAYLFNDLYEKIVGRRAALDPLDLLNDALGDLTGAKLNNVFDMISEGVIDEGERGNPSEAIMNFGTGALEELPFVGGLLGGGRIPISSALPDAETIVKGFANENWSAGKKAEVIGRELGSSIGTYILPPFAGGLGKKLWQTGENAIRGGRYVKNAEGEDQLQYPYFSDTIGEEIGTIAKSAAFGPTATEGGQDWVEGGFGNQNAKKTALYRQLTEEMGESQHAAWDLLRGTKGADKYGVMQAVAAADLSEAGKAEALKVLLQGNNGAKFEAANQAAGVTADAWAAFWMALPDFDADGNGSFTQAEVAAALERTDVTLDAGEGAAQGLFGGQTDSRKLTNNEKAALWSAYNPAWKAANNPFDAAIGERVTARYNDLRVEGE